eukprot:TRINITY_DN1782_c0_g1_i1.p1 TRINITY_DN1782_c0_g1~~TRINITY_DN1782_c0_g1_i1.p1  ORF type:complete len:251 (+),score=24.38 TRINITY_DN1782_c0_g1_i1:91-843(+)
MIRRPPRSTLSSSSAASDVYKRQGINAEYGAVISGEMATPAGAGLVVSLRNNSIALLRGTALATAVCISVITPLVFALENFLPNGRMLFVCSTILVHETLYFSSFWMLSFLETTWPDCKLPRAPAQVAPQSQVKAAFKRTLMSHLTLQPIGLTLAYSFYPCAATLDSVFTVAAQLMTCQFCECLMFYTTHRMLHSKPLYARIHKVHHEFKGTVPVAAEHAHPIEQILGNHIPVFSAPIFLGVSLPVFLTW